MSGREIKDYWMRLDEISRTKIPDPDFRRHFTKKDPGFAAHSYTERISPVVRAMQKMPRPVNVLELGCGLGLDACLFASYAEKVVAVDISPERMEIFGKLASELGVKARIDIELRDVFSFLENSKDRCRDYFDIIWIKEAISHIHPLESLFRLLPSFLKSSGRLFISESNVLNPLLRKMVYAERLQRYREKDLNPDDYKENGIYLNPRKYMDPVEKREVVQANERMLTASDLGKLTAPFGLNRCGVYYSGFVPERLSALLFMDGLLKNIPLLKSYAVRYTAAFKR